MLPPLLIANAVPGAQLAAGEPEPGFASAAEASFPSAMLTWLPEEGDGAAESLVASLYAEEKPAPDEPSDEVHPTSTLHLLSWPLLPAPAPAPLPVSLPDTATPHPADPSPSHPLPRPGNESALLPASIPPSFPVASTAAAPAPDAREAWESGVTPGSPAVIAAESDVPSGTVAADRAPASASGMATPSERPDATPLPAAAAPPSDTARPIAPPLPAAGVPPSPPEVQGKPPLSRPQRRLSPLSEQTGIVMQSSPAAGRAGEAAPNDPSGERRSAGDAAPAGRPAQEDAGPAARRLDGPPARSGDEASSRAPEPVHAPDRQGFPLSGPVVPEPLQRVATAPAKTPGSARRLPENAESLRTEPLGRIPAQIARREVVVELPSGSADSVTIQLRESRGEVHLTVRNLETAGVDRARENWSELGERLRLQGWEVRLPASRESQPSRMLHTVMTPVAEAHETGRVPSFETNAGSPEARSSDARSSDSRSSDARDDGRGGRGGQPQQGRQQSDSQPQPQPRDFEDVFGAPPPIPGVPTPRPLWNSQNWRRVTS